MTGMAGVVGAAGVAGVVRETGKGRPKGAAGVAGVVGETGMRRPKDAAGVAGVCAPTRLRLPVLPLLVILLARDADDVGGHDVGGAGVDASADDCRHARGLGSLAVLILRPGGDRWRTRGRALH